MSQKVILVCSNCLSRNYVTSVNIDRFKKNEVNKFCPKCGKHTIHKISK